MRRTAALTAAALALATGLTACAPPEETPRGAAPTGSAAPAARINDSPQQNRIIPAKVDKIAALLPESVRKEGKLLVGVGAPSGGFPPLAFTATDNKTLIGSEPDVGFAVAGILGLEPVVEFTSFENLFIGLNSGKFHLASSNITVTEERKRMFDFATYRLDNMAFEAKKGSGWTVAKPADLAGKRVAVASGTSAEKILVDWAKEVEQQGLKPIDIKYYQTHQAVYLALGSGQLDVYFEANPAVAYHVAVAGETEFIGTMSGAGTSLQGKIALMTKKDNGLVEALAAAVNELIRSGDYAKILDRWNLAGEAVQTSEVNPPGLPMTGK